jgi:glycosyltransferase involved in cell wall biosynthesis
VTVVAALLVTKDSRRWIEETAVSITRQTRPPDLVTVVDDFSADGTVETLRELLGDGVAVVTSTAVGDDRVTRIAHNFRQGLRACRAADIVVLGDHDDVWRPDRIAHQAGLLEARPQVELVASDGALVDDRGGPLGRTLRSAFPVDPGYNDWPADRRMRFAIRRSVATGGASALRAAAFADDVIPAGWLHDRWWSLVAAARETLWLDDDPVIDYRVSSTQEVGLDTGDQDRPTASRLWQGASGLGRTVRRLGDLRELREVATPATRPELGTGRLLRTLL